MAEPQFDELYREVVLDHYRRPRCKGTLSRATHRLSGMNPVCGDEVEIDVRMDGEWLAEVAIRGEGCAISQASASMMAERVSGKDREEAAGVARGLRAMLVDGAAPDPGLGDLASLEGVAKLPVRVKCALLCWNVLAKGLKLDYESTNKPTGAEGARDGGQDD